MTVPRSKFRVPRSRHPVIGLLGGVGAGKSLVASHLARLGCAVVEADGFGHALLREPAIRRAIRRRFGDAVFGPDGEVDRRRLADRVFASRRALAALEAIVHPRLWRRVEQAVRKARRTDAAAVVLDAALILEKGLDRLCDVLVYIKAPKAVRRRRARQARGWGPSEVARRESSQVSLKTKQNRADYIIDNSASPEHTFEQIRTILSRIVK